MGASSSNNQTMELRVGTLNYSGILKSPYQFFEREDKYEEEISLKMKEVSEKKEFKYQFGPLDKKWQEQRYSPLYQFSCGLKNNVHLMSKKQFFEQWDEISRQHDAYITKIVEKHIVQSKQKKKLIDEKDKNKGGNMKADDENPKIKKKEFLENLKQFDFSSYKAILETIYTTDQQRAELAENFERYPEKFQLDSRKYRDNRKKMFLKPFLNEDEKIHKTIQMIKKYDLDILFLQEANFKLIKAIEKSNKELRVVQSWRDDSNPVSSQSIIIIKQNIKKFPKFKSFLQENTLLTGNTVWLKSPATLPVTLTSQQIINLNLNKDTVIQCLYNIILISTHLSSKKQVNFVQILELKRIFTWLKAKFPECHVLLGADLNNSFVEALFEGIADKVQEVIVKEFKSQEDRKNMRNAYNDYLERKLIKPGSVLNIVPKSSASQNKIFTVNKKRTWVQAQPNKSDELKQVVIDYIVSDLEVKDTTICTLDSPLDFSQKKPSPLLPSSDHPYDHYLVTATVVINEPLKHTTDLEYKYKYQPTLLTKQQLGKVNKQFITKVHEEMKQYENPGQP